MGINLKKEGNAMADPETKKSSIFIYGADSFLGRQLGESLVKVPEPASEDEEPVEPNRVVGTVTRGDSQPKFLSATVDVDDDDAIKAALRESDVVVYDLATHNDEARAALQEMSDWAAEAKADEANEDKKTFILISSPLVWGKPGAQQARIDEKKAKKEAEDEDGADETEESEVVTDTYTETEFKVRRPHPQYVEFKATETMALKCNRDPLKCYIVCPGLLYGAGEDVFHSLFRNAWELDPPYLPLIGDGNNVVPTIHVKDLVAILSKCALETPETPEPYILAVDRSNHTLKELVTGISSALGRGEVRQLSRDDVIMFPNRDLFQLDLRMSGEAAVSMLGNPEEEDAPPTDWHAPMGMIAAMKTVTDEYRVTHNLTPLRMLITGPPACGKSYYAAKVAAHYKINHVTTASAVADVMAASPAASPPAPANSDESAADPDEEVEVDPLKAMQDELQALRDEKPDEKVMPGPELLARMMKFKLNMPECQNQGFILDGYPATAEEAKALFAVQKGEEEEEEEETADENGEERPKKDKLDETIAPATVIALEGPSPTSGEGDGATAVDDEANREALATLLRDRLKALPQSEVEGTENTQEIFEQRLAEYEALRKEEGKLATPYFVDKEPLECNILTQTEDQIMQCILVCVGKEHNYGKSAEQIEEEREKELIARLEAEEKVRKEQAEADAAEAAERTATIETESRRLKAIESEERELLEERSKSLREYLIRNVIPTLTEGLIEVCKRKPDDPVDFLDEYLFEQSE